jgi:peptidyl-prolyl cis-trans isomerase B (cyclophilin B)
MRDTMLVLASLVFFVAVGLAETGSAEVRHEKFTEKESANMSETRAVIETNLGNIGLAFFPDVAPNHVKNFIDLAQKGFYDGAAFHRVIPGFMIQGGDPKSKDAKNRGAHGTGGPGYTLKAEFNKKSHKRGTLSMARSANPDSAGSQFFICVADTPWLDGQYSVFGEVRSGMDVADKIVNQARDHKDNPLERVEMKVRVMVPGE